MYKQADKCEVESEVSKRNKKDKKKHKKKDKKHKKKKSREEKHEKNLAESVVVQLEEDRESSGEILNFGLLDQIVKG